MSKRSRRHQPYDLNNPINWTSNKLKIEIEQLGVKLTASVSKSALLQIYRQLSANDSQGSRNDTSDVIITDNEAEVTEANKNINARNDMNITQQSENDITGSVQTPPSSGTASDMLNSTLSVISGMQNTITTLQTTVNKLLTDKQSTSQTSSNLLDKIYQNQGNLTTNAPLPVQQQGIAADELPHIDIVSESVRRNITDGKYVNLACLLLPEFDTPNFTTNDISGLELLRQSRRDHRLDRALTITQFYKAFGIYKRIMCEAYPQRRLELDHYEADVGNIYDHFGDIFYQYHVQFSKKAAAYLERGVKVDWSKRNKDLFQLLVGGAKIKLCEHCSQSDHQSPFCPSQINVPGLLGGCKPERNFKLIKADPNFDKHGRPKLAYQGKEICNNYNHKENGCNYNRCPFLHVCKKCRSTSHGEQKCDAKKPLAPPVSSHNNDGEKSKQKASV